MRVRLGARRGDTAIRSLKARAPVRDAVSRRELFRLFLAERRDPEPFYTRLASRDIAQFPLDLRSALVLDLASGPGYYATALADRGAVVVATDLDRRDLALRSSALPRPLPSDVT